MDFIRDTMALTPTTWDRSFQYNNKRYITVELEQESNEFKLIEGEFRDSGHRNTTITAIKRIQHPFAYARYNLHKEYLQASGASCQENTEYTLCASDQAATYIDYNCDQRRLVSIRGINPVYIRIKKIRDYVLGDRDSNRYPEYIIVTEHSEQHEDSLAAMLDRLQF